MVTIELTDKQVMYLKPTIQTVLDDSESISNEYKIALNQIIKKLGEELY